jgi:hypothetical protein
MDVYDRLQREDMMQAAVVLASFLYNAAMRDDMMPRKPFATNVKVVMPEPPAPAATKPAKGEKKK